MRVRRSRATGRGDERLSSSGALLPCPRWGSTVMGRHSLPDGGAKDGTRSGSRADRRTPALATPVVPRADAATAFAVGGDLFVLRRFPAGTRPSPATSPLPYARPPHTPAAPGPRPTAPASTWTSPPATRRGRRGGLFDGGGRCQASDPAGIHAAILRAVSGPSPGDHGSRPGLLIRPAGLLTPPARLTPAPGNPPARCAPGRPGASARCSGASWRPARLRVPGPRPGHGGTCPPARRHRSRAACTAAR